MAYGPLAETWEEDLKSRNGVAKGTWKILNFRVPRREVDPCSWLVILQQSTEHGVISFSVFYLVLQYGYAKWENQLFSTVFPAEGKDQLRKK